jgi:hypothetical protein
MEDKKVREIHEIKVLTPGRKLIGNFWEFPLKDNGRYQTRTEAEGFSQIPGKDFIEKSCSSSK